jgi:hypothetical protein
MVIRRISSLQMAGRPHEHPHFHPNDRFIAVISGT